MRRVVPPTTAFLFTFSFLLAGLCGGCASGQWVRESTAQFPPGRGFVTRHTVVDGQPREFVVFVPRDYSSQRPMPAILFLHGLFESGSDADRTLRAGLGPVIAERADNWPFIVIFPQSAGGWKGPEDQRVALASLASAQREFAIDQNRIILAGFSAGGREAWLLAAENRGKFAAVVTVAAETALEECDRLRGMPVWAFHNSADPLLAASGSEAMVKRIAAAGGDVKLTEFRSFGHDCWDKACNGTELVPWMLRQRRRYEQAALPVER